MQCAFPQNPLNFMCRTQVEERYREYKRDKDLVIVEGATVDGIGNLLELNGRFAAEMDAPVLMVGILRVSRSYRLGLHGGHQELQVGITRG